MKLIICAIFASSLMPSMAMANFCRWHFDNQTHRDICEEKIEGMGIFTSGDWSYKMHIDKNGQSFMMATNYPLPNESEKDRKNPTARIQLACVMDAFAAMKIESSEPLTAGSNIKYKFNGEEYQSFGENILPAEFYGSDGSISTLNHAFIDKFISGSVFQIRSVRADGTINEETYTLDGGSTLRSSLSCLAGR
ncbi:hypothetical protein I5K69_15285 [Pseudomonas aeruginosa]|nr:hypothetical protein [Pseudomonas aeruginosa]MBH9246641.1 hypothetical protein [Pseudomonas aeruginosa]